jgi:hydroxyacylglutathione hydrolase
LGIGWCSLSLVAFSFAFSCLSSAQGPGLAFVPEPKGANMAPGNLPDAWPTSGPKCMQVPDWWVHEYNSNTYIIRQSGCSDYEKPFLYLLFGKDRALLIDSGSRKFPAAAMLQDVAGKWLERNQRKEIDVVVVHSHPHSDHVAGDAQLRAMNSPSVHVTVVTPDIASTKAFYGIKTWPSDLGYVDLGDRVLDAIGIPGHSPVSIALYDRQTGILFTGDSLYPGRLYVLNWNDFKSSTERLVSFTRGKIITHILGCHVEETTTPYADYPIGTIYQPEEHELALSRGALLELSEALQALGDKPTRLALRDFTIWPVPPDSQLHGQAKALFEARLKDQEDRKWNQTNP